MARFWFRRFKSGKKSLKEQRGSRPEIRYDQILSKILCATASEIGLTLIYDESTIRKPFNAKNFIKQLDK